MEIKSAAFTISSAKLSQCPQDDKMEFAFIGRSNVGKSSLINMLTGHKGLAKTSATPGKTLLINHFLINGEWYIIDLPGYGFAKRSKSVQRSIDDMITSYILHREQLVNVFLLIDVRHEPQKIDTEFMNWLGENGVPFSIVFTKADKLSVGKLRANVDAYLQSLLDTWEELPPYFVTSSEKKQGREPLLDYIESILLGSSGS
jgi:GTP-binding protein